jgi:hypothetical protein
LALQFVHTLGEGLLQKPNLGLVWSYDAYLLLENPETVLVADRDDRTYQVKSKKALTQVEL